ncbi:hypothetical protein J6590_024927 [Homalodisca vitripennis]|nr:hypothetical protein J6590_024927 [Homalodisca vitripennis]
MLNDSSQLQFSHIAEHKCADFLRHKNAHFPFCTLLIHYGAVYPECCYPKSKFSVVVRHIRISIIRAWSDPDIVPLTSDNPYHKSLLAADFSVGIRNKNFLLISTALRASVAPSAPICTFVNERKTSFDILLNSSSDHLVQWLSQDNRIKQRRAWLLLGWMTAERSCPCKQPTCPAIGGGSEVTFKPLVPSLRAS